MPVRHTVAMSRSQEFPSKRYVSTAILQKFQCFNDDCFNAVSPDGIFEPSSAIVASVSSGNSQSMASGAKVVGRPEPRLCWILSAL